MPLIYLSGPMTKDPDYRENFEFFEKVLEGLFGYKVFNPVHLSDRIIKQLGFTEEKAWLPENREIFLREDIRAMLTCDAVVMLPNWRKSKGAKLEHKIAKLMNMEIVYV